MANAKEIGDKIRSRRKELGIKQKDLAEAIGISSSLLWKYESGKINDIKFSLLEKLAQALNISPFELTGATNLVRIHNYSDTQYVYLNVYGTVPAGIPIEAVQDIIGQVEVPITMFRGGKDFIALKVKGSSMYPRYIEGDIVVVELTSDFTSGQDVVVYVNGYEATLKKIYKNDDGTITLKPINPEYMEMTYGPGDEQIQVLGVVRKLMRDI